MSETRKPLLFGDPTPDIQAKAEADNTRQREFGSDPFYIPGYSELVKVNDIAAGVRTFSGQGLEETEKRKYYKRFGTSPRPLPLHFMPVRIRGADGKASTSADIQADQWKLQGYRPATKEDFEEGGIAAREGFEPPTAMSETADGHYQAWDTELWVVDGERHRLNERQKKADADWLENVEYDGGLPESLVESATRDDAGERLVTYNPNE